MNIPVKSLPVKELLLVQKQYCDVPNINTRPQNCNSFAAEIPITIKGLTPLKLGKCFSLGEEQEESDDVSNNYPKKDEYQVKGYYYNILH